jgi:cytochrome c553
MHALCRVALLLLPPLLIAAAPPPDGKAIAERGNGRGAAACSSCHGAAYQGNAAIHAPAIAGLPAAYVELRLQHYASPQGHNALMRQVAASLSPDETRAVALYLSRQPKAAHR